MSTADRQARAQKGQRAERQARWWLRLTGHRILARNYRCKVGEVDIIARPLRPGAPLLAIEVKARATESAAREAVSHRQCQRIARALQHWQSTAPATLRGLPVRFDLMALVPGRLPRHIRDAWRMRT
ncbi:YraN family protein [Yunchengibacter salinarum]|uniref:YraN family protein n=1 Tax=Yunchengibacter salinarum TaxID=3133399 RepID=UPI0035B5C620